MSWLARNGSAPPWSTRIGGPDQPRPRISNLDEFAPLAAVPDLRLVWARTAAELAGAAIGWQAASVPGVDAHGLFESSEVARALFGAQAPTLEASFERLAECIEAAFAPGVLDDLPAGR